MIVTLAFAALYLAGMAGWLIVMLYLWGGLATLLRAVLGSSAEGIAGALLPFVVGGAAVFCLEAFGHQALIWIARVGAVILVFVGAMALHSRSLR